MSILGWILVCSTAVTRMMAPFTPQFTVLYSNENPHLAAKPAGIENVSYNVPVWNSYTGQAQLHVKERSANQFGDGFDDEILSGEKNPITPNFYQSGEVISYEKPRSKRVGDTILLTFQQKEQGQLVAKVFKEGAYTRIRMTFIAGKDGYFSIGYTGAPAFTREEVTEIWQPLIWQEQRIPSLPYMTLAYRCPIPTTLVNTGDVTYGVVADSTEMPFDPLPTMKNSRFGVALITNTNEVQPQLFAPVLGGQESRMRKGQKFTFLITLVAENNNLSSTFEHISCELMGFHDYRQNVGISLNATLDNMIDYAMSPYSLFTDSLKGCNYSTDAPGTVKNVSSLNPLQIALLTGREDILEQRAYPIMEYMLSRGKFLFAIDPNQKIQSPGRQLTGPCAPISELTSLYQITGQTNDFLISLAENEYNNGRVRNLDSNEPGRHWHNALALYQATNDSIWLKQAVEGADEYLTQRIYTPQTDFSERNTAFFFWTGFAPDWVALFQLYEATGDDRYLDAAHQGAREYAQFIWFIPTIPRDSMITVNPDGWAPHYPYLKNKGYKRMPAPKAEEQAWQLSEIGLTSESSGTSTGHRGIFMANFAPWMLRIGYLTHDNWLQSIARSAIIGRYKNFPGYHINTARTNVYEFVEYPYKPYNELSVNSFHFNHIWPHTTILTDYLITDAFVKSEGQIDFPSMFIEGFAYLKNKFYGFTPGHVYEYSNINLFLPQRLLTCSSEQLNYIAGYDAEHVYLIFTNQSKQPQNSLVTLSDAVFKDLQTSYSLTYIANNTLRTKGVMNGGKFPVEVSPEGITVVVIDKLWADVPLRHQLEQVAPHWQTNYVRSSFGVVAMIIGVCQNTSTLFVYDSTDDANYKVAKMRYKIDDGAWETTSEKKFPFEFTIPLTTDNQVVELIFSRKKTDRTWEISEPITLQK